MKLSILFLVMFITSVSSYSQDHTPESTSIETSLPSENFAQRWWRDSKNKFSQIIDEGENDMYLSGYAYHDRNTYTPEKLRDLNEGAYGTGLGRSIVNENGNTEMLYAMSHLDSHKDVQAEVGYAWVKKFSIIENLKFGIGYSAFIVSRSDIAKRIPVPFALPLLTVDVGRVSVNAIIIPKLNDGINNGNVVFFFAKFTWGRNEVLF